jgi:hypothetical protein
MVHIWDFQFHSLSLLGVGPQPCLKAGLPFTTLMNMYKSLVSTIQKRNPPTNLIARPASQYTHTTYPHFILRCSSLLLSLSSLPRLACMPATDPVCDQSLSHRLSAQDERERRHVLHSRSWRLWQGQLAERFHRRCLHERLQLLWQPEPR